VGTAARSPPRSIAGALTLFKGAPISCAMICERVVLPRPGGPKKSTWSRASRRAFAARRKILRFVVIFGCPTYSSSERGRREDSTSWSSCVAAPEISRGTSYVFLMTSGAACDIRFPLSAVTFAADVQGGYYATCGQTLQA